MRRRDYKWINNRQMEMPCMECGKTFTAARDDACFCGPSCRKKASRRKERVQQALVNAMRDIQFLKVTQVLRPDLKAEVDEALDTLRRDLGVTTGVSQIVAKPPFVGGFCFPS